MVPNTFSIPVSILTSMRGGLDAEVGEGQVRLELALLEVEEELLRALRVAQLRAASCQRLLIQLPGGDKYG